MALKTLDKLRSTFKRRSSSSISTSLAIADDVDDLEDRTIYGTRTHDWSMPKQKWQGEQTASSPEIGQESDFDSPDATQQPQTANTSPMFDEKQAMFETSVHLNGINHLVAPNYPNTFVSDGVIDIYPADDDYVNSDDFYEEYPGDGEDIDTCEDDLDSMIDEVNGNFSDEEENCHNAVANDILPRPRMLSTVVDVSSASSDEELQQRQRRKKQEDGIIAYVQEKGMWVREMRSKGEIVEREVLGAGVI